MMFKAAPSTDLPVPTRPHALYYVLTLVMIMAFGGFTIGLTFAPCHSSMCIEEFFPLQTRLHIAAFYAYLIIFALLLTIRVIFKAVQKLSNFHLSNVVVPVLSKRASVGGILFFVSTACLTFGLSGFWYPVEIKWWNDRGALVDYSTHTYQLAWTGITGHWCDIWLGLVIIPVGRNSILGRLFQLHVSTLLFAHKLLSYTLVLGVLVHGIMYYMFVGTTASAPSSVKDEFFVDNPTITVDESAVRGLISFLVLPTGVVAFLMIIVVVVSSLPKLRRKSYNMFYIIHIVLALMIMILTCLHASTNFYFLLPGIVLWIIDWAWRFIHSLRKTSTAVVENAGNGWYRIRMQQEASIAQDEEKFQTAAMTANGGSPLQTYYIIIPTVSKIQIHPFTAAVIETPAAGSILLYQKSPERKKAKDTNKEWTWKLAALVDFTREKNITLPIRIEGPYSPVVPEMYQADHILLVVGGTGITGALSISQWWADNFRSTTARCKTLRLVWTYRTSTTSHISEVQHLQAVMKTSSNMEFITHISSQEGRLNPETHIVDFIGNGQRKGCVWVYASGPDGLLTRVEDSCVEQRRSLRNTRSLADSVSITELDWYIARWSL